MEGMGALLFLWWLWIFSDGGAAQPGRDCLSLCPANNISCALKCAQCDFDCCGATCSAIQSSNVCNPSCFAVTLNVSACCIMSSSVATPPPPPPPAAPSVAGPGNCTVVNLQGGNLTLVEGVLFTFNFSAVTCSAAVCGACSAFTGPANLFGVTILENSTGLSAPQTSCNVTSGAPPGLFPVTCLSQNSVASAEAKYLLTASILSYGVWIPLATRYVSIIAGPTSVPACVATWVNGTNAFVAGTTASLEIVQKDAFNNTVCERTGRTQPYSFPLAIIYDVPVNTTAYKETFSVKFNLTEGIQTITFVPNLAGTFYLQIGNSSQVIQKSPLRYDVLAGPLSINDSSAQWPSGINTFEAGTPASLLLLLVDRFGNSIISANDTTLNVTFRDSGRPTVLDFNVTILPSGFWSANFLPIVAGQYLVRVGSNNTDVPISPLPFSIVSGPVSVMDCFGSWLGSSNSTFISGAQATFTVLQMDAYKNNVSLATGSIDAYDFNASVRNLADGSIMPSSLLALQQAEIGSAYRIFIYSPNVSGSFELYVGGSGSNITGSPFPFIVLPGPLSISRCRAVWGGGNNTFVAGTNVSVFVYKYDKNNGSVYEDFDFTVTLISSGLASGVLPDFNISIQNVPGSSYNVITLVPTRAGKFSLAIGTPTDNIANSPLAFTVNASSLSTPSCVGEWTDPTASFTAGTNVLFDVTLKDRFNNTATAANGSFLLSASVVISQNDTQALSGFNITIVDTSQNGRQRVKLNPTVAGSFFLRVWKLNESISGSPFPFTVTAGAIAVANCTARWPNGVNIFRAGEEASVNILLMDKFGNNVSSATGRNDTLAFDVNVIGVSDTQGWNMTLAPQNYSGYQTVLFYPLTTGSLALQVGSKKVNISGSPFSFTVKGGALSIPSSTGQLLGSYFTQNGTVRFVIFPRDTYGNQLSTTETDPSNFTAALYNADLTLVPIPDVDVAPYSGFSYLMTFSIQQIGKFILQVGNDTEDIAGSPFILYGATDTVEPSRCLLEGDGIKNSTAGTPCTIVVQLRDISGNPAAANLADVDIKVYLSGVLMAVGMNISAVPKTTGIFQATYKPTVVGQYQLAVSWKGLLLGAGIINKTVLPSGVYGPWCSAQGAVNGGVAGTILSYQVMVLDYFNNTDAFNRSVISVTWWPTFFPIIMSITDLGFGKFNVVYNITRAGTLSMTVLAGTTVATEPVNGSPFGVVIQPGPLSLPNCFCALKNNINYTFSGRKAALGFFLRDKFTNPIYSIQDNVTSQQFDANVYNGSTISGSPMVLPDLDFDYYTLTPSDWYELKFTIIQMGTYTADPYSGSFHFKGGPFVFQIVQEPPNSTVSTFSGPGLQNTTVGQVSEFNATLRDYLGILVVGNFQGYNTSYLVVTVTLVNTSVSQQAQVVEDVDNRGIYQVTYSASVPGNYAILLNWKAPLFTTFVALYNITVFPAGVPVIPMAQGNTWDPGIRGSLTALDAFMDFNLKTYRYSVRFEHPMNFSTKWIGFGKLEAASYDSPHREEYNLGLYVDVVAVHRLQSRNSYYIDTGDPTVSGEATSFLSAIDDWERVVFLTGDWHDEALLVNTTLSAFQVQGVEFKTVTVYGERTSKGQYMVSLSYEGNRLSGSPLLVPDDVL